MRAKAAYLTDDDRKLHFHGWDSTGWFSHESGDDRPEDRILRKLRKSPAGFHGKFTCNTPGFPAFPFQTTVHDLTDSGLAVVRLDGASGGPIGALAVVPAHRRARLREDYAFGLVAHLSFLDGLIAKESQLAIHDYAENALRTEPPSTLVFTVESPCVSGDLSVVLSDYLEKLSVAMLHWLCGNDAEREIREEDFIAAPMAADDFLAATL